MAQVASPVSPAPVANVPAGTNGGDPMSAQPDGAAAKPDAAAAAKPGDLTIVGIVAQDDGEFDVLQAAVTRD